MPDNCSQHKATVEAYNGSMDDLVEDIGNLRYDALQQFMEKLGHKLMNDGVKDHSRGRHKLALELWVAASFTFKGAEAINDAWKISKPFMKDV
jgi:hypothetical protein